MREIKFRAWDSKSKKWAFTGFHVLGEVSLFDLLKQYSLKEHINLEISQYTGSKDKNGKGKEIYDKDCFETASGICVVEWVTDGWFVLWADGSIQRLLEFLTEGSTPKQIAGNVFENPTLLEK